jgi:hypothetical protein
MSTDTELRIRGVRVLVEALGAVEAERFIALMLREPFDYTHWQKHLWAEMSVPELSKAAAKHRRDTLNEGEAPSA